MYGQVTPHACFINPQMLILPSLCLLGRDWGGGEGIQKVRQGKGTRGGGRGRKWMGMGERTAGEKRMWSTCRKKKSLTPQMKQLSTTWLPPGSTAKMAHMPFSFLSSFFLALLAAAALTKASKTRLPPGSWPTLRVSEGLQSPMLLTKA